MNHKFKLSAISTAVLATFFVAPIYAQDADSDKEEFVVATETGILHRMKKMEPTKEFIPASDESVCEYMKMITIDKLLDALKYEQYEVKVDTTLAEKARLPIERMLAVN